MDSDERWTDAREALMRLTDRALESVEGFDSRDPEWRQVMEDLEFLRRRLRGGEVGRLRELGNRLTDAFYALQNQLGEDPGPPELSDAVHTVEAVAFELTGAALAPEREPEPDEGGHRWSCECGMRWVTEGAGASHGVSRCPRCGSDQLVVDPALDVPAAPDTEGREEPEVTEPSFVKCPDCNGHGYTEGRRKSDARCGRCEGSGRLQSPSRPEEAGGEDEEWRDG